MLFIKIVIEAILSTINQNASFSLITLILGSKLNVVTNK